MILVALGSNLPGPAGSPPAQVERALAALAERGIAIVARSRWWRSAAWPDPADPPFVNGVARLGTSLAPRALLGVLHDVEAALGRVRGRRNAPRPIDLDLIDHEGVVVAEDGLVLPHPRLTARAFVLLPLAEVAPAWRHPVTGQAVAALIERLPAGHGVEPLGNTHG